MKVLDEIFRSDVVLCEAVLIRSAKVASCEDVLRYYQESRCLDIVYDEFMVAGVFTVVLSLQTAHKAVQEQVMLFDYSFSDVVVSGMVLDLCTKH